MTKDLFEKFREPMTPTDPHVQTEDVPRLTGQNLAILQRLFSGSATNRELAVISLKYTSRISDIRDAGYIVECERLKGGLSVYRLKGQK